VAVAAISDEPRGSLERLVEEGSIAV